jgi:hypothetical protein
MTITATRNPNGATRPAVVAAPTGDPYAEAVELTKRLRLPYLRSEPPRVPWRPQQLTPTTSRGWC